MDAGGAAGGGEAPFKAESQMKPCHCFSLILLEAEGKTHISL